MNQQWPTKMRFNDGLWWLILMVNGSLARFIDDGRLIVAYEGQAMVDRGQGWSVQSQL